MSSLIKVEKCLSFSAKEEELTKVFKSGFCNPQMYYVVHETAYDGMVEFEHVTEQELSETIKLSVEEIQELFL